MRIRTLLKLIFYFPGAVLHELAHYVAALLLGKAEGFSVVPRREGNTYVLGSVKSRTKYKVLSSFIALAPMIWWLILFLTLRHLHVVGMGRNLPHVNFSAIVKKLSTFRLLDVFFFWLFIQMLWAGRLSFPDIKNVFRGLFSFSGIVMIGIAAAAYYFIHTF
ncbi:MAG: hypothetical protein ACM3MB_04855 [Acidobacteriota bacterium]